MLNAEEILLDIMNNIQTDVINSMQSKGRYATGETMAALEIVQNGTQVQLLAPKHIDALEYGRGPTTAGAVAGNPPLIDRIKAWCDAKGIDQKAAWAIKKNIDKVGYPGIQGVLTEPLSDDNLDRRLNAGLEEIANDFGQRAIEALMTAEI